eukprot:GEMP01116513.1.p1 GENE.GEMP01116513.1~~GEMP01116513.1.p1  ORF type:complete len:141 (+),score=13.67 GEMP01116513.1:98-520(+)
MGLGSQWAQPCPTIHKGKKTLQVTVTRDMDCILFQNFYTHSYDQQQKYTVRHYPSNDDRRAGVLGDVRAAAPMPSCISSRIPSRRNKYPAHHNDTDEVSIFIDGRVSRFTFWSSSRERKNAKNDTHRDRTHNRPIKRRSV